MIESISGLVATLDARVCMRVSDFGEEMRYAISWCYVLAPSWVLGNRSKQMSSKSARSEDTGVTYTCMLRRCSRSNSAIGNAKSSVAKTHSFYVVHTGDDQVGVSLALIHPPMYRYLW